MGVAHRAVEEEGDVATGGIGHLERGTVDAFADEGQTACATRLDGLFFFAVLEYRHFLEVVGPVEWAVDSPVVWYADILPRLNIA